MCSIHQTALSPLCQVLQPSPLPPFLLCISVIGSLTPSLPQASSSLLCTVCACVWLGHRIYQSMRSAPFPPSSPFPPLFFCDAVVRQVKHRYLAEGEKAHTMTAWKLRCGFKSPFSPPGRSSSTSGTALMFKEAQGNPTGRRAATINKRIPYSWKKTHLYTKHTDREGENPPARPHTHEAGSGDAELSPSGDEDW